MDGGKDRNTAELEAAGARVYEGLNKMQKEELDTYLAKELGPGSEWYDDIKSRISDITRRRSEYGESLDVHDVTSEVLSYCRLVIPMEVRVGLFRRILGAVLNKEN
uniref:Uncharacterized protein n=1 Tax=Trypanosoma congolense (strain IL3000) TaxID=1068625 RepID=G0UQK8_TRYCI|nr:conserved hypothetical protein [Trypanosoma congolense IL3000]